MKNCCNFVLNKLLLTVLCIYHVYISSITVVNFTSRQFSLYCKEWNKRCLFVWLVGRCDSHVFFVFRPVRLCRELRPPRRTVVIPGIQSLFRLKTKRHNLNARSIIQKKDHNSPQFPKTLSTARSIICSFFEHNREKPKPRLEIKSPQIPGIVYFPATLSSKDVLIF